MIKYTRKTLSAKLGIGIETIRYYEKIDLIPPAERGANGYRVYTEDDVLGLKHILMAKKYGFSLEEIKIIMGRYKNNTITNEDLAKLFNKKINDIENQILDLKNIKSNLIKQLKTYQP